MSATTTASQVSSTLDALGLSSENHGAFDGSWIETSGPRVESLNPATGEPLAAVRMATAADYERVAAASVRAFEEWRTWPAPRRGEIVRQLGEELRRHKEELGRLVTLEVGKVVSEGLGEVQEMIDMCDLAVGMSRQLYGLAMHSERPKHRMYEQWHPLGPVGIITAFNFPVAVWAWNAAVAAISGDSMIWKPSHQAPLTALAVTKIADRVLRRNGAPPIFNLILGGRESVGEAMVADPRLPLISATGSVRMGKEIGKVLADRLGRGLLELGGNNGILVMDDADLDLALRGVLFAAVGTAGQRCTTTRRLFLQRGIAAEMKRRLVAAYGSIRIGDPAEAGTLMGPLVDQVAVDNMMKAIDVIKSQGGRILYGGKRIDRPGFFVEPTLVEATPHMPITCEETFAPILYLFEFDDLDEAIRIHNSVPQGLSSAIFTLNMRSAERFLAATGSDCGIANVNIGTSGAEIGGAFGGEKETGGGREAGSDSWKAYMRRQTCTLNWGTDLPLAQGVEFKVAP
jgi:aldehyde dehydrogenase (NAD+)